MNSLTENLCAAEWRLEHEGTYEDFIVRICGGNKKHYQRLAKLRASEFAGEYEPSVDAGVLSAGSAGEKHEGADGFADEADSAETAGAVPRNFRLHACTLDSTGNQPLAA